MLSNPPPSLTSPPWSSVTKRTVALIVVGLALLITIRLAEAWSVIVIAIVLSYLLYPIVDFTEKYAFNRINPPELRRVLAVMLTFVIVILGLTLVILLIVPPVISQLGAFADNTPEIVTTIEERAKELLDRPVKYGDNTFNFWEEFVEGDSGANDSETAGTDLATRISSAINVLSKPAVSVASLAFSFFFNVFLVFALMFYLLKDGGKFIDKIDNIVPVEYQGDARRLIYELGLIWNAYLRGQIILGIIMGVTTGLTAAALGLPQPLVLGLLAGLLEFIPNIGPIVAALPALLFALISESNTIPGLSGVAFMLIVMAAYFILQQTEALVVVPRVMGRNLDLHPFVVMAAVLFGASLAGLLGILLAAPTVATVRLFIIYIWGKLVDRDPFAHVKSVRIPQQEDAILPSAVKPALAEPDIPDREGEIVHGSKV